MSRRTEPAPGIESLLHSWEQIRLRLVPVLGAIGFRIIFARSLHLARREHPWLAVVTPATEEPLDDLMASLAVQPPDCAREADRALHAHFIELLHALIGDGLTSRLLDPPEPGPGHGP